MPKANNQPCQTPIPHDAEACRHHTKQAHAAKANLKSRTLALLPEHRGNMSAVAATLGIDRNTLTRWRTQDPQWDHQIASLRSECADAYIDKLAERFFDGVEEPVYHLGRVVGTVRRYDNRVGMFMLKSLDPRFSDKVVHSHGVERDPEEEAALMRLLAAPGGVDAVTAAIEQVVVERLEDGDGDD